ncbi:MAG TPA: M1 family metallopeptidase [Nocardioidaceae bacterium]|nr:M1 family metallopeptidase [Nocardioidaceae bacterium]
MTRIRAARRAAATLVVAVAIVAPSLPSTAGAAGQQVSPSPGAPGVGDRLYPRLGNGGYDALHYSLRLRYATRSPAQAVQGTVRMVARSTKALSRFNLDFGGTRVGRVLVDGRAARAVRVGEELVVTPARAIAEGAPFVVVVRRFRATPTTPDPFQPSSTSFFSTRDGSATAGQPDGMHDVFPSNDHPRDKAAFAFRIDVPRGTTAVANGVLTGVQPRGRRTVFTYRQQQPMATELTQVAVGAFRVVRRDPVDGVRVRDVVPRRLVAAYDRRLAVERQQLRWMRERVGDYPFDTYGSLLVDTNLGFALETQTLSLFDTQLFRQPRAGWEPVMLHELAHQWFGNSVSPRQWSDVWVNEGHATWYELSYAADRGQLRGHTGGFRTVEGTMRRVYEGSDFLRSEFGPVARPRSGDELFNPHVYYGGALALFALRQQVGVGAFRRIEQEWVRRYQGRSASTRDFIRLSSEVSGQPLDRFLTAWLYGSTTPPMPGRPNWQASPARASLRGSSGSALDALRGLPLLHRHGG